MSPAFNTSTITTPSKARELKPLELETVCRLLRIGPIKAEFKSFHATVKSGPIGQALLMSSTEATLLPLQLVDNIKLLGGKKLASRLEDLRDAFDILPDSASQV